MPKKKGKRWKANNGRTYSTKRAATRSDRTGKVGSRSKAARKRRAKRRTKGKRR